MSYPFVVFCFINVHAGCDTSRNGGLYGHIICFHWARIDCVYIIIDMIVLHPINISVWTLCVYDFMAIARSLHHSIDPSTLSLTLPLALAHLFRGWKLCGDRESIHTWAVNRLSLFFYHTWIAFFVRLIFMPRQSQRCALLMFTVWSPNPQPSFHNRNTPHCRVANSCKCFHDLITFRR